MHLPTLLKKMLVVSLLTFIPIITFANKLTSRPEVQDFIQKVSQKYDFSPAYLYNILSRAKTDNGLIEKMNAPYEAKPWYDYQALFLQQERIDEGVKFLYKYRNILQMAQKEYGVPPNIIVAIIGVETRYGQHMGDYRVLDSLTTLAFDYPPRAQFFQNELAKFFLLTRQYNMNPLNVYGSRAGAMGMPQFMPSSVLLYGASFKSPMHTPNIFTNGSDAIFSVGNFLMQHGWDRDEQITTPAKIVGDQYQQFLKSNLRSVQQPKTTIATFEQNGVTPAGVFKPTDHAYLIALQNRDGVEYWLAFNNFHVITQYNNSDQYAMAVYQFAQAIDAGYEKYVAQKKAEADIQAQKDAAYLETLHKQNKKKVKNKQK